MSQQEHSISRRSFLQMVGVAGGAAAVYETMTALGLLNKPTAWAGPLNLASDRGQGQSVLILGAGIGGLTSAYELSKAGYSCEILEAQNRAGGRSLTARHGSVIHEQSELHGETEQVCQFDQGLYLNMGPGRLPYHHRRVLHYCKTLNVPLEVYVMETTANLYQTPAAFEEQAIVRRRIDNDSRGYIAELLSKAVKQHTLDEALCFEDCKKLLDLLEIFGDLQEDGTYTGSTRSGCAKPLTVTQGCEAPVPLSLQSLLDSQFWRHHFYQPQEFEWQPTLFQPVGGMDQIVEGFKRQIGDLIHYETEVRKIVAVDDGVEVTYHNRSTGETGIKRADYCVSNIPLPVLQKINTEFAPDFQKAVDTGRFANTCKVGWQANERFWESDSYEIYGGISFIDDIITQMWYPSNDYFTQNGTLTGAYNFAPQATAMGKMSLPERLQVARKGAIRLHEEFENNEIVPQELGLSIAWQNVPFQRGGWANWNQNNEAQRKAYSRLLNPDRRFHIVGDQVSMLPGWQEGAMTSAEHVVSQIAAESNLAAIKHHAPRLPNTDRLVRGRI